jgi:hypothetical protein
MRRALQFRALLDGDYEQASARAARASASRARQLPRAAASSPVERLPPT